MEEYPKRDKFFSHRFVRLLQKSCAAQDIGQQACLLLCYIVHTEDAARYSGPVRFWNEQLMTVMAFKSPKQLTDARSRAEDAGWLVYERSSNRQVGRYWVTIPTQFEGLTDDVIEPNHSANHSAYGKNNGTNTKRITERISNGSRNEYETESGKPSIPIPIPPPYPDKEELKSILDGLDQEEQQAAHELAKRISRATKTPLTSPGAHELIGYAIGSVTGNLPDGAVDRVIEAMAKQRGIKNHWKYFEASIQKEIEGNGHA